MSADLTIGRQWVAKARNDLLNADNNLVSAHIPTDTVCFHCQQATEKMLKAMLAAHGIPPPRTHVLMMLAGLLAESFPSVEQISDDLVVLTPYAVASRYPDDDPEMPSIEDAHEARQCAERVALWLRREYADLVIADVER